MPINPFDKNTQKLGTTVAQIQSLLVDGGTHLLGVYTRLNNLVNANPDKLPPEAIYKALGEADTTQLKNLAVMAKTLINTATPDTINDGTPQGKFVMPEVAPTAIAVPPAKPATPTKA